MARRKQHQYEAAPPIESQPVDTPSAEDMAEACPPEEAAEVEPKIEDEQELPPAPAVKPKSFIVKPGLRLSSKHKTFWCIGKPLKSGVPFDVLIEDLNDAQKREIETKKGVHILVEEIAMQIEVEDEIGG